MYAEMTPEEQDAEALKSNMGELQPLWDMLNEAEGVAMSLLPAPAGEVFVERVERLRKMIGDATELATELLIALDQD